MSNKVEFKRIKVKGSFYNDYNEIIINGVTVGNIHEESHMISSIPFAVVLKVLKQDINEDGNESCIWKNLVLKPRFKTLEETKVFVVTKLDSICKQFALYDLKNKRLLTKVVIKN